MKRRAIWFGAWGIVLLAGLAVLNLVCAPCDARPEIIAAVRIDCAIDDNESELRAHEALLDSCEKARIPVSYMIVPTKTECVDGAVKLLQPYAQRGELEIGMHGFDHLGRGRDLWGGENEFEGIAQDGLVRRFVQGRERLEKWFGVRVVTFAPAFNHFDETAERALEEAGFHIVSASYRADAHVPPTGPLLRAHADAFEDGERICESARATGEERVWVFLCRHFFENEATAVSADALKEFRDRTGCAFETIGGAAGRGGVLELTERDVAKANVIGAVRFAHALLQLPVLNAVTRRIQAYVEPGGYFSEAYYARARTISILVVIWLGVAGAGFAWGAGEIIRAAVGNPKAWIIVAAWLVAAALAILWVAFFLLSYKKIFAIALVGLALLAFTAMRRD